MRKSQVIEILSRRLNVGASRIEAIAQRLADAGLLSRAEGSRRYPPDLAEPEITALVLAVIADRGLGNVRETVELFSVLRSAEGQQLDLTLATMLFGQSANVRSLVLRHDPVGVSLAVDNKHILFGAPAPTNAATKAAIIPGDAIMAIAAELQGTPAHQADTALAVSRLQHAIN